MSTDISLIVDIVAVAILVICVVVYGFKGFVSAIIDLVGSLGAMIAAYLISRAAAPSLFNGMFRTNIYEKIVATINESALSNIEESLRSMLFFVPEESIRSLLESLNLNAGEGVQVIATKITDDIVAPLVTPIVMALLFVILFIVFAMVIKIVSSALKLTKKIPVIGKINTTMGIVLGIVMGCMYVLVFGVCLVVLHRLGGGADAQSFMYESSILYKFVSALL